MKKFLAGIATAAVAVSLAACGGGGPSPSACKDAMKADFANALLHPAAKPASEPAACKGLSSSELATLAAQVLGGR